MGVKDLNKFLKLLEYDTHQLIIKNKKIGIDMMCLVYIITYRNTKTIRLEFPVEEQKSKIINENNINDLNLISEIENEMEMSSSEYIELRDSVFADIVKYCYNVYHSTNEPYLIWDAPIWGKSRCEGKIFRSITGGFRFRTIDITWMALKLAKIGFTSYFSYGDGERTAAFLCKNKIVDAILTTDTDPICMGCPIVCDIKGVKMFKQSHMLSDISYIAKNILELIRNMNDKPNPLVKIALFLGNDYINRKTGNGVVKLMKTLQANKNISFEDLENDLERVKRAFDFFKCLEDKFITIDHPPNKTLEAYMRFNNKYQ